MRILFMYLLLLIPNTVFSQVDTSVRKSIAKFLIDEKEISNKENTGKMLYPQTNLSLLASLDTCNKIYLLSFSSTSFHSKKYHLISSPNIKKYIYSNVIFEAIKTVDSYIDTLCSNITDNNKIEIIESLIFANKTRSKKITKNDTFLNITIFVIDQALPKEMYDEIMKEHEFKGKIQNDYRFTGKGKRNLFIVTK